MGDPLRRGTEVPEASMASMDWMVALKEATLATGASVPMTKASPVFWPDGPEPVMLPHPAIRIALSEAAASESEILRESWETNIRAALSAARGSMLVTAPQEDRARTHEE